MSKSVNIAITGAAGRIGYALVFRLANGDLFGTHDVVNLRLLEVPSAMKSLHGIQMELDDCNFTTLGDVVITDEPEVGVISASSANQEVLSKRLGQILPFPMRILFLRVDQAQP